MTLADNATAKVSIIVAAYNSQDTIEECLKSILAQNYPRDFFEVIVMDGGSKDATVKIAEKFPIRVVSIRLNAPAAYNYAMKIAAASNFGFH
jgi:glycosyltransferase involved in cell wall biosynthesis